MIVFYNPHVDDFLAIPPHFSLLKRRALLKYSYLLKGMVGSGQKVQVLVDGAISAFIPDCCFSLLPKCVRRFIAMCEVFLWININHLQGRVKVFYNVNDTDSKILFAFSYKAAIGLSGRQLKYLNEFPVKIFHLSHYYISTGEKSENLQRLDDVLLAGDSDISNNSYFQRYFSWYKNQFLVLPFAVAPRFRYNEPFQNRESICIATGTFHNLYEEVPAEKYLDFIKHFHSSTYHPVRKLIYDNSENLKGLINIKISPYRGSLKGGTIERLLKHFLVSQKAYFSINIVDLYNNYQYAVVGEEVVGFPALGAFESMGCGCVLIAQPEFYGGLKLVAGEHFIAHSGSLNSILEAIEILNKDPVKALMVSKAGAEYVDSNLRPREAYMKFLSVIKDLR